MKVGDLVRSGTDGALGLIGEVEIREPHLAFKPGEKVYHIFWVDEEEPAWYYEHEVESVDAPR